MEEFRHITMITAIILSDVFQSAIVFAESVNCKLPTIKNADINMTGINRFSEGTVVHFHCLPGFRPVGDGLYRCANSKWVGGNFSCLIKTCPLLESPPNGEMIGDNYEIGSVMRYKCDIGFELTGSKTSLCKMDQQWHPPNAPKCRIRKCLAAPVIEYGELIPENKIEGFDYNDYGATLRARCNSGYMINGPVRIYCDSKGQWTQIPECRPISCPSYLGLDAKCVRKTTLADKTLLIIFCTANSTLISARDETASCENNKWDDPTIRCLCDCEIKADTDFVHIENLNPNRLLRHNETLEWSCKNGATKLINDSLTCIDGTIKPQGWGCFIPSLTSVDPIDSTDSGAVDKSRNENDNALANLKIAIIIPVVVGVLVVILVLVVICLKYRRGTILKDGDTMDREPDHEARTADTASETEPNGAADPEQANSETEDRPLLKRSRSSDELEKEKQKVKIDKVKVLIGECKVAKLEQNKEHPNMETKSNKPTTSLTPLKEKEITEDFANRIDEWDSKKILNNKTANSQISHIHEGKAKAVQSQYNSEVLLTSQGNEADSVSLPQNDGTEALSLPQGAGVVSPKPSQGDGAGALITSQDDRAQAMIEMSQDFSEISTDVVSEISEEAITQTPEVESYLPSHEEQNSLYTPTTEARRNIVGDPTSCLEGASSEGRYFCPGCGKAVTIADKPFHGRWYHRECFICKRCNKRQDVLYDHASEPYCYPCYRRKYGDMRSKRRSTRDNII